jgi:hypothetical protein
MTLKRILLFALLATGFGVSRTRAVDTPPSADSAYCLEEIKDVCAGLDDAIETCIPQRGTRLSAKCHDLLQSAIRMAQSQNGPARCMDDIKRACPGLDGSALTQCIVDKKETFSSACQDSLQTLSHP